MSTFCFEIAMRISHVAWAGGLTAILNSCLTSHHAHVSIDIIASSLTAALCVFVFHVSHVRLKSILKFLCALWTLALAATASLQTLVSPHFFACATILTILLGGGVILCFIGLYEWFVAAFEKAEGSKSDSPRLANRDCELAQVAGQM